MCGGNDSAHACASNVACAIVRLINVDAKSRFLISMLYFGVIFLPRAEANYDVTGVTDGTVELPCNITSSVEEEPIALILWYKDNSSTPIYTIDARSGSLDMAKHFPGEELAGRADYDPSLVPSLLRLHRVREDDAGLYRCRIDYRQARTDNQLVSLQVIVPPHELFIVDEYGQRLRDVIGPYNEGSTVLLVCEAEGGKPPPEVTWWQHGNVIDNTYTIRPQGSASFVRNEVLIGPLQRSDLMIQIVCLASNNNFSTPLSSGVVLDMNLKPTEVRIITVHRPVSAGVRLEVKCQAKGARPYSQITWWKGQERLTKQVHEEVSKTANVTSSRVNFVVTVEDNGVNLTCRADNPHLPKSDIDDVWTLNVHYVPRLSLVAENSTLREGGDTRLHCSVDANPPITKLSWKFNGRELAEEADVVNNSLQLHSVTRQHHGHFQCVAKNSEGTRESDKLQLEVLYSPVCKHGLRKEYGAAKDEMVRILCEVEANPTEVNFEWTINNSMHTSPIKTFLSNKTKSIATMIPNGDYSYGILLCWAENSAGRIKEPCEFTLMPAGPPEMPKNCSAVHLNQQTIVIRCVPGSSGGLTQIFQAEVFSADTEELLQENKTAADSPHFTLRNLPLEMTYTAMIYAVNAKGRSPTVAVRFSTFLLTTPSSKQDENPIPFLRPLFGFIIGSSALLLLALIFSIFMVKRIRRRKPSTKELKETCALEKYHHHHQSSTLDFTNQSDGHSPDLISTQYGLVDQPDVANTGKLRITSEGTECAPQGILPAECTLVFSEDSPSKAAESVRARRWLGSTGLRQNR